MDRVYLDTGDVLVTDRRVAFESVSVPLDGITAARVEQQARLRPARRKKLSIRDGAAALVWCGVVVVLIALALQSIWVAGLAPPGLLLRLLGVFLAVTVFTALLLSRRQLVLVSEPVWAVVLTTDRREVELFRTRHQRKAASVVDAIYRALVAAGRSPAG